MKKDVLHLAILLIACAIAFVAFRAMDRPAPPQPTAAQGQEMPAEPVSAPEEIGEIPAPEGFARRPEPEGSFAAYLRSLPLKAPGSPVRLHDGRLKGNQSAHLYVLDLDLGPKDLQQCADAVIRLRAEYLYSTGRPGKISFRFTSGDRAEYAKWREGYRARMDGNRVRWERSADPDPSYAVFREYLDQVFTYAGTASLAGELERVPLPGNLATGDVFIKGGFPGHAVIVADVVEQAATGRRAFLLAQSYMPAQEIHVLKNPRDSGRSPWYLAARDGDEPLVTPEWSFVFGDLRRFPP